MGSAWLELFFGNTVKLARREGKLAIILSAQRHEYALILGLFSVHEMENSRAGGYFLPLLVGFLTGCFILPK